jgi:exodeoxyribonuclease VII small subunit
MIKAAESYQGLSSELDTILNALQAPEVDIDSALELYKRGQKVLKELERYLQTAENTVRKLNGQKTTDG